MSAKRHRHEFTALWWHFGPYGRQDVHVHSCYAGAWLTDPIPEDGDCDRVLIGHGRECEGPQQRHWRETLKGSA